MNLVDFLLGRPIASEEDEHERVGPIAGIGILGLDALASAAYGPEALLTALLPLGSQAPSHVAALIAVIVGLLIVLGISYSQTIRAYPNGGGAYTVARENLGTRASLVAAAALMLDYVLNVAVAISAGVGALVSAIPALWPHTLALCLALLALLTLVNLRGVRSTGFAVLAPTYLFLACLFGVMLWGVLASHPDPARAAGEVARATQTAARAAGSAAPASPTASSPLGGWALAWLLMAAFANGCTAMTGVEAVSNGVPIFKEPSVVGARRTLFSIVGVLIGLLAGIAYLLPRYRIVATPPGVEGYESVLSQLTSAIVGRGPLYYLTIGSIIAVLGLSANTSFADFPRVCRLLARDRFLPEPFVHRGRRLAFSHGIWALAGLSGMLLVVFGGITDHLIPLFAIGALSAFTTSQVGMMAHWRKRAGPGARAAYLLNLLGALATGATLLIVLVSKFGHGAWISISLVAGIIFALLAIRRHYDFIARATETPSTLEVGPLETPVAIVPMRRWDAVSLKALSLALGISRDVFVVQVLLGDRDVDDLRLRWRELAVEPAGRLGLPAPTLIVKRSEFRSLSAPLLQVVRELAERYSGRPLAVVLSELVEPRWYHYLLHGQTAALLRHQLRMHGGPELVIVNTPWYLRDWLPERYWLSRFMPRRAAASRRRAAAHAPTAGRSPRR
jgi:amino acid transporter